MCGLKVGTHKFRGHVACSDTFPIVTFFCRNVVAGTKCQNVSSATCGITQRPHFAREILKRILISTVRPTVHTNPL